RRLRAADDETAAVGDPHGTAVAAAAAAAAQGQARPQGKGVGVTPIAPTAADALREDAPRAIAGCGDAAGAGDTDRAAIAAGAARAAEREQARARAAVAAAGTDALGEDAEGAVVAHRQRATVGDGDRARIVAQ